ncbi:bacteriorhodopsin [Spirosoma pollinicola]|uniref:Rhodopsin n=1 Tax=Spirosoma pollinicola TaxID=2057025 RepID=A0A2K8Z4A8_9BACT|nr:bacteriorhodopsin [Spirosoma pollinicola]AUD04700.1 hypothetical protein CWM47_24345 [Spirosoma pollinicola]
MEIADSFVPTAGVVGLLPMVTYFFLVVAMFVFIGLFVFSLAARKPVSSEQDRPVFLVTPVIAAVAGLTYYLIQVHYHDVLADLVTVPDGNDRQTLIRESYNAISQYRYMALFIITPLLAFQLLPLLQIQPGQYKRPFMKLLAGSSLMVFACYIGHQQLTFDNEIQAGPFAVWAFVALIIFGFLVVTVNRLWKELGGVTRSAFRFSALILAACWTIYFLGYFLTLAPIDANWIQLVFTLADMASILGVSLILYLFSTNRWSTSL